LVLLPIYSLVKKEKKTTITTLPKPESILDYTRRLTTNKKAKKHSPETILIPPLPGTQLLNITVN